MQITKKGIAHLAKVWRCKCPLCGTEVKIIEGDPSINKYHNESGTFREIVYWDCPVCEQEVKTATSQHHGSETINLISCKTEVLSPEEREERDKYPGFGHCVNSDEIWWDNSSKWNCDK